MQRVILFVSVLLIVLVGGAALAKRGSNEPAPQQAPRKAPAKAKPWNGRAETTYDVSLIRAGRELHLSQAIFLGLNTTGSKMTLVMQARKEGGRTPAYLTPLRFRLRANDGRVYLPKVITRETGGSVAVKVVYEGVPTRQLAAGLLTVKVNFPRAPFAMVPVLPSAPAGHRYAEKAKPLYRYQRATPRKPAKPKKAKRTSQARHAAKKAPARKPARR